MSLPAKPGVYLRAIKKKEELLRPIFDKLDELNVPSTCTFKKYFFQGEISLNFKMHFRYSFIDVKVFEEKKSPEFFVSQVFSCPLVYKKNGSIRISQTI